MLAGVTSAVIVAAHPDDEVLGAGGIMSVTVDADEQAASRPAAKPSASSGVKLFFRNGRNLDMMPTLYQMQQRFD